MERKQPTEAESVALTGGVNSGSSDPRRGHQVQRLNPPEVNLDSSAQTYGVDHGHQWKRPHHHHTSSRQHPYWKQRGSSAQNWGIDDQSELVLWELKMHIAKIKGLNSTGMYVWNNDLVTAPFSRVPLLLPVTSMVLPVNVADQSQVSSEVIIENLGVRDKTKTQGPNADPNKSTKTQGPNGNLNESTKTQGPNGDLNESTKTQGPNGDLNESTKTQGPNGGLNESTKTQGLNGDLKASTKSPRQNGDLKASTKSQGQNGDLKASTKSQGQNGDLKASTKTQELNADLNESKKTPEPSADLNKSTKTRKRKRDLTESRISSGIRTEGESKKKPKTNRGKVAKEAGLQCAVCKKPASAIHHCVPACYGCKLFFGRNTGRETLRECNHENPLDHLKGCKFCRFICCLGAGMLRVQKKVLDINDNRPLRILSENQVTISQLWEAHQETFLPSDPDIETVPGTVMSPESDISSEGERRARDFILRVPGIDTMDEAHKEIVVQHSLKKVMVLRLCSRFCEEVNAFLFPRGRVVSVADMEKVLGHSTVFLLCTLGRHLLCKISEPKELCLLSALVATSSGLLHSKISPKLNLIFNSIWTILITYTRENVNLGERDIKKTIQLLRKICQRLIICNGFVASI